MRILLIEDNDIKRGLLDELLTNIGFITCLKHASSYQSGVESIVTEAWDCVILDMTLPVSDLKQSPVGMEFLTFGGELILRETARRNVKVKFIVVSQYDAFVRDEREVSFDQLRAELLRDYQQLVLGCVRLERDSVNWQSAITKLLYDESINH